MPRNERQQHGFKFEDWLKKEFFDIHYGSKWDIPKELNPDSEGGHISIKTAKWRGSIYFGDAIRQFEINEVFTLIVGFWENIRGRKKVVKIVETIVPIEKWKKLWHPLTLNDIKGLDEIIKNRDIGYITAREKSQTKIKELKDNGKWSIFTLNPKIDSKDQRRLQCSISFRAFFKEMFSIEPDAVQRDRAFHLWGKRLTPPDF